MLAQVIYFLRGQNIDLDQTQINSEDNGRQTRTGQTISTRSPTTKSKSYNQASDSDSERERDHESVLPPMEKLAKVMTSAYFCCDESESHDENEPQGYLTRLQMQLQTCYTAVHCLCLKMLTCAHSKAIKEVSQSLQQGGLMY